MRVKETYKKWFLAGIFLSIVLVIVTCTKSSPPPYFKTKNVVVIVVDGPRYEDTWGDSTHEHIPFMYSEMAEEGVTFTNFWNNGPTNTTAGHTALLTGHYENINNAGMENPKRPSYLSYWLKKTNSSPEKAWIFGSKDKIAALADTKDSLWAGTYVPLTDCGVSGLGSGYRVDSITLKHAMDTMNKYLPPMVFINLKEPDMAGHAGIWENYLAAIEIVDQQYYEFWNFLRSHPFYKDNTAIFITNDHGRHSDHIGSFDAHGDGCDGCRHVNLYAYGPDFEKGKVVDTKYEQIDLSATISTILGLKMNTTDGEVIKELTDH